MKVVTGAYKYLVHTSLGTGEVMHALIALACPWGAKAASVTLC